MPNLSGLTISLTDLGRTAIVSHVGDRGVAALLAHAHSKMDTVADYVYNDENLGSHEERIASVILATQRKFIAIEAV